MTINARNFLRSPQLFILIFLAIIPFSQVNSQHFPIRFNHLNTHEGLSHNRVTSIYKDKVGYMWFGTLSGLNRYNGYEFKTFKHDPSQELSINDHSIQWIGDGPNEYLWIKSNSGFSAYDVYKEQFVDINPLLDSLGYFPGDILKIIVDKNSNSWFAAINGGLKVVDKAGEVKVLESEIGGEHITDITTDSSGDILVITEKGLLVTYDITEFKPAKKVRLSGIYKDRNEQLSIFCDTDNDLWVWSRSKSIGLLYFDEPSDEPEIYNEQKLGSHVITAVIQDNNGQIVVATDHGGISILNKKDNSLRSYKNEPADSKSLSHNSAISLCLDDNGIIWIGTNKAGVNYFLPGDGTFNYLKYENQQEVRYNDIKAIVEDDNGNFWIGTDGAGLLFYDRLKNNYRSYRHESGNPKSLNSDIIASMLKDGDGIWIGTYHGGLCYFNGRSFQKYFNTPNHPDALSDDSIWEIFKDSNGNLWIGTLQGGVDVYDKNLKKIHHFSLNSGTLNSNYITSIIEDKNGQIWIGTGYGIEVYDPDEKTFRHYLNDPENRNSILHNSIVDMNICEDGEIWIGSYGGVNKYDPINDNFISFTEKDGLVSNFIVSVIEDNSGSVWVGSNKGLSRISKKGSNYIIQNFDEADGLQGDSFNDNSVLKTKTGELAFGGLNGMNLFNPDDIRETEKPQNLVFTEFYITNKRINSGDTINGRQLFAEGINRSGEVELKPYENSFTFEFAALSYFHPEKTLYRYMLEGFDPEWVTVSSDQRRVSYTNLDPGNYNFKVQASNDQDHWGQEEIAMALTIQTPFWETPLAFALYGALGLAIFMGIRKIIIDRERLTATINHEKFEADRLHQLDLMKIRFFTNVSHEFRTPLTLILTPVERLLRFGEDSAAQNDYLMIRRNARRLLNLVNQLLDFRKMETGQLTLSPSGGDFIIFMKDIIESFSDISREKSIPLKFSSSLPELLATFDKDKVEKIMFNLLSNAFKFTHSGGMISVEIADKGEHEGRCNIEIKVSDTGIGIPEDKVENIFTRFFQVETPATMINNGSGIGLSITKEFVELHGGTIQVESKVGKGSCFTLNLILKKISSVENTIEEVAYPQLTGMSSDLIIPWDKDKYTVFLAEDNTDFRFYLKDNLKQHFNILEAGNGKDAWKIILNEIPDLIVSDIMMPVMNGVELTKKVKKDPRTAHIPVILLTAHSSNEYKIEGLDAGAIEYITKPFNFEILVSSIKSSLKFQAHVRESGKKLQMVPSTIEVTSLDEKLIQKALALVEENMENADFSVVELSRELGVSRGQLYKKILEITGLTPIEFIRDIRLKRAVILLQKSQLTVAEIAYKVGFNNPRYFTKYFKEAYKTLPSQFKKEDIEV